MFPGVDGFHWAAGHVIFLSAFFTVLLTVIATVSLAGLRAVRDMESQAADVLRWREDFLALAPRDRACRHAFTGELPGRVCENGFDCAHCAKHAELVAAPAAAAAAPAVEDSVLGFQAPLDRMYHRGHTWVKEDADGALLVGLDALGTRLIGKPDRVELPPSGATLRQNGVAWRMFKGGAEVGILAPLSGKVIAAGGPGAGFWLRLKPENPGERACLLRGPEVLSWMTRELERLQLSLGAQPALADGGSVVDDILPEYPRKQWDTALGDLFLEP